MRFELFLTELPKASASRVEDALTELPKGASTATILKAMESRKVPTVSVAWSDDKRVLNEVLDTLLELGAGCKLVDHGSFVQRLVTWSAEKLGRARYLEDADEGPRTYIKLGSGKDEPLREVLLRHTLTYALELCLAAVLFVWFVALRVGFARIFSVPELMPQLAACAAGLLVAYACTESIRAVQTGRLLLKRAVPQLVAGGCLSLASLFFLGDGFDQTSAPDGSVKRPPSLPYAGLLTELRRRKLAEELNGHTDGTALERAAQGRVETEEEPWCDGSEVPTPDTLQCRSGPAWEDALACLAEPAPAPQPVATKPARRATHAARPALAAVEPAALPPPAPEHPWAVTLELSTAIALLGMWLLSLWLLALLRRDRALAASGAQPASALATTAQGAGALASNPQATDRKPDDAQLSALRAELDTLRGQLVEANEALGSAQLGAGSARKPEDAQLANVQRELELTRSTLGANQAAFAQLKQQHAQATSAQTNLSSEIERLKQELASTLQERDLARAALLDMGGRGLQDGEPEGRAAEVMKVNARAPTNTNTNADDSSYSVSKVQEERVVLQKRRR